MSLYNSLRDKFTNKSIGKKLQYLKEDGTPKTIVRSGKSNIFNFTMNGGFDKSALNLYYNYYLSESTIWSAINSISFNTIMVGYNLNSDDENALKIIKDFCIKTDLDNILLDGITNSLIFGDAYVEIIYNKKHLPTRLKNVDPRTMSMVTDKYGDIIHFEQEIGASKVKLNNDLISHLKLFNRPDSPYGISLIGPSINTLKKKVRSDNAIYNAIMRHGTSKYVITIGSSADGELPPESILQKIESEVEDLESKNELIVPWNVNVTTIDENGVEGVEEYYDYFQTQLVVGLLCPEESLGTGRNSTSASATVKAILYERMISSFQKKISRELEHSIFNKILKANGLEENLVSIEFNNVTEADEALRAKWMADLMKGFRTSNIKPFTINEVRAKFSVKPIDLPEANTLMYGESYIREEKDPNDNEVEDEESDDSENKPKEQNDTV